MWSIFLAPIKTQVYRALALTILLLFLLYIFVNPDMKVEGSARAFPFIFAASLSILLVIKMYLELTNEGLKRLGLILCILSGLLSCYITFIAVDERINTPELIIMGLGLIAGLFGSGMTLLLGRKLYLWVQAGFNSPQLDPTAKLMEAISEATPAKDMALPSSISIFTNVSNFYSHSYKGKVKAWKVFVYGYLLPLLPTSILVRIFSELDALDALYWLVVVSFVYNIWLVVSLWKCSFNVSKPFYSYFSKALSTLILVQSLYLVTLLSAS